MPRTIECPLAYTAVNSNQVLLTVEQTLHNASPPLLPSPPLPSPSRAQVGWSRSSGQLHKVHWSYGHRKQFNIEVAPSRLRRMTAQRTLC